MDKLVSVAFVFLLCAFLACDNGKGKQVDEPYDGGHGIGIDTATIHQIDMMEDSVDGRRFNGPLPPPPHEKGRPPREPDNMRGFDPASEDDMDDNGMSRYMENNDEEGWD